MGSIETIQVNVRLSKSLVQDLERIANHLKVNKLEWLKVQIAQLVWDQKLKLYAQSDDLYLAGHLDDAQYVEKNGFPPSDYLKLVREGVASKTHDEKS